MRERERERREAKRGKDKRPRKVLKPKPVASNKTQMTGAKQEPSHTGRENGREREREREKGR